MAVAKQFSIPIPQFENHKKNSKSLKKIPIQNPKIRNWRKNEKLENQLAYHGLRRLRTERKNQRRRTEKLQRRRRTGRLVCERGENRTRERLQYSHV